MRLSHTIRAACLGLLAAGCGLGQAAEPVTIESLLHEMIDRAALARFPEPAYVGKQASSYDRDSVSPQEQRSWYANWDRSQFVRIEEKEGRKEYVMMDEAGPGAIVHVWATWHGPGGGPFSDGTLRVYIDGNETPAIEGKASEVIDKGLLAGPPLSEGVSPKTEYAQQGHNLYLPIPYAKHCKVTYSTDVPVDQGARKGEALYYQINYRTYGKDVSVESFSMERLKAAAQTVEAVNKQLAAGGREPQDDWTTQDVAAEIAPGGSSEPIRIQGPGAIRSLECRVSAADVEQALRSTVVEISFDGERTVWCPIGEFCGAGYKPRNFKTWYTAASDDGRLSCAWVMPFEREAVITLHNLGDQPVQIAEGKIRQSDWTWDGRSMHFHANWRQLTEVDTGGKKEMTGENAFDVNYVTATGQGVYVGDTLTIMNGAAAWWGEGDEKIFVDGEEFPSHFGTGTEDYYGYAWCRPEYFTAPFHAQPEGGGNLAGGYSVNDRYRSLDAIPFTKSLKFDMELWHWADTKVNFAPATFWYGRPGATSNVKPDPKTAALPVARERTDIVPVFRVKGAIEGESLKVVECTGGRTEAQHAGFGWSGEAQLWWMDGKAGDLLVLQFPVEKAGRHKVSAALTKAVDYAIVEVSVNDGPAKKFDRFNEGVAHDLVELGTFDLAKGANRLNVKIVGENPKAVHRRMFGLDYLKVE
ncbi:MAG: DUF2961 domain-containing protein [Pirellulales bacterium]|nr:DUF2961 domain-containing protein [Pirellulales bacterium]